MAENNDRFINLENGILDELTLANLGAAVIANWRVLPTNVQHELIDTVGKILALDFRQQEDARERLLRILELNGLRVKNGNR